MKPKTFLRGMCMYEDGGFAFSPDFDIKSNGGLFRGVARITEDGRFTFMHIKNSHKSHAKLIKKLPHGRLSITKDGYMQLTLRVSTTEAFDPLAVILRESNLLSQISNDSEDY